MTTPTIPKYKLKTGNPTVDVSGLSDEDVFKIVQDLNDKGYVVYETSENLFAKGIGAFNGNVVGANCTVETSYCDFKTYLRGDTTLICVMQTPEQLAKLRKIKAPIILGKTDNGDYTVVLETDRLKIGCQTISKRQAILMARTILKEYKAKA